MCALVDVWSDSAVSVSYVDKTLKAEFLIEPMPLYQKVENNNTTPLLVKKRAPETIVCALVDVWSDSANSVSYVDKTLKAEFLIEPMPLYQKVENTNTTPLLVKKSTGNNRVRTGRRLERFC